MSARKEKLVQIRVSKSKRRKLKVVASQNGRDLQEEADVAIDFYLKNRHKIPDAVK